MSLFRILAFSVALFLTGSGAGAATQIIAGGQLVGASDVDVAGELFDVAFVDGTCIALFSGCDEPGDFSITSEALAIAAAQALLDQVLLTPQFDNTPQNTFGCTSTSLCQVTTPWGLTASTNFALITRANNSLAEELDNVSSGIILAITTDTSGDTGEVYAMWSPVPEPTAGLLVAAGLAGLAAVGRRRGKDLDS